MSKKEEDKGIVYCNRVLLGNWYEASKLEEYKLNIFLEQMKNGDLMLAKYRKMTENLNKRTVLTQSSGSIGFGAKIALLAPHVPASDPPQDDKKGLLLGGRITSNEINYSQDLEDGCNLVGLSDLEPAERNTFIITSADYCDRNDEPLKYNQEFLLALSSSVAKKKPLYFRFDPNPVPGLCGMYPIYLSKHPVSNTRWRILPVQRPDITRFEQEGKPVNVNTDIIINHCFTNLNLGMNVGCWVMGFHGKVYSEVGRGYLVLKTLRSPRIVKLTNNACREAEFNVVLSCYQFSSLQILNVKDVCVPLMKTCLDVYGNELPNNIWQIYVPIAD